MTRQLILSVVLLSAAAIGVSASVPLGVYAIVDRVILEPEGNDPQRVQIWGTFALWDEKPGVAYQTPERGYLYYACSKEQLRICRNEWADLKSIAGTGDMIGFGSRSLPAGRVRAAGERVSAPEAYPIQFGVVQMGSSPRGAVFDRLKALARVR
jgi:hypothetical protein